MQEAGLGSGAGLDEVKEVVVVVLDLLLVLLILCASLLHHQSKVLLPPHPPPIVGWHISVLPLYCVSATSFSVLLLMLLSYD